MLKDHYKLRDYQAEILSDMNKLLYCGTTEILIAAGPGSGKTFIILSFIKANPDSTFLVLTHGTNTLKNQWKAEFKNHNVEASTIPGACKVTYGLPQGKRQLKLLKHVDYLVIDEAHQFTFAKTVQDLIDFLKPKHIVYPTATPSEFIRRGYKPLLVPGIELIKQGVMADLYVGMVSTSANIEDSDYNAEENLTKEATHKTEATVDSDLDELLAAMHDRLCETNLLKRSPTLRKAAEWSITLGSLHKTMIACASVKQANKVEAYFKKKKINVVSSNYQNDKESEVIEQFKSDPSIKVLVVVDRGTLGFNLHELVNVVDLTGSRNINRIYQLFTRATRVDKNHPNKYFFKFSTDEHMLLNKFYMSASLMLLFPDFISKYNGKNLNGCEVLTFNPKTPREDNEEGREAEIQPKVNQGAKPKSIIIDKLFKDTVSATQLLIDIYNKIGQGANEYAYTTFNNILHTEFEKNRRIKQITEEHLDYLIATGQRHPGMYE